MNKVRAKFQVAHVTQHYTGRTADRVHTSTQVRLQAVQGKDGEDKGFWEATPQGEITMTITNPAAADAFRPGDRFYVDFERVSE